MKNACAKTVKRENAYEVWATPDGSWTWYVLKKWQANDDKPYARWFCDVVTPYCPNGEMGDVYVSDIKSHAVRIDGIAEASLFEELAIANIDRCSHPVIDISGAPLGFLGTCMLCDEAVSS